MAPHLRLSATRRQAHRQGRQIDYPAALETYFLDELHARLSIVKRTFNTILYQGPPLRKLIAYLKRLGSVDVLMNGGDLRHLPPSWTVCFDDILPINPGSYDLVISVMHMHGVPKWDELLFQYRAALRADGLFLVVFPGQDTLQEIKQAALETDAQIFEGAHARVISFVSAAHFAQMMQKTGFILPVIDVDHKKVHYPDLACFWQDIKSMAEQSFVQRNDGQKGLMPKRFATLLERVWQQRFKGEVTLDLLWGQGWVPGELKTKQLRPGQGRTSLKEVLEQKD